MRVFGLGNLNIVGIVPLPPDVILMYPVSVLKIINVRYLKLIAVGSKLKLSLGKKKKVVKSPVRTERGIEVDIEQLFDTEEDSNVNPSTPRTSTSRVRRSKLLISVMQ